MTKGTRKFLLVRISDGEATGYALSPAKKRKSLAGNESVRIIGEIDLPPYTAAMLNDFGIQRLVDRVAAAVEKDYIKMSFISDAL